MRLSVERIRLHCNSKITRRLLQVLLFLRQIGQAHSSHRILRVHGVGLLVMSQSFIGMVPQRRDAAEFALYPYAIAIHLNRRLQLLGRLLLRARIVRRSFHQRLG